MSTTTPRRALPGGRTALRDANDQLAGAIAPILPRRSRPAAPSTASKPGSALGAPATSTSAADPRSRNSRDDKLIEESS